MAGKKNIIIYAGYCIPIHANVLQERPLGGTETGVVRVAEILEKRGHTVRVYTSHKEPPASSPKYFPAAAIHQAEPCDVFIAVQDWTAITAARVEAKQRFYWTGDGADQYVNFGLGDKRVYSKIDKFLAVSEWHAKHLTSESGLPFEKAYTIHNGVHLPWFEGNEKRNKKRLIYTSTPYRGLALVPNLYSALKKLHPEIELHVFAGLKVYDRDKPFAGPEKQQFEQICQTLEKLPDCSVHGNISQSELAREFMKSGMLFYPNVFRETSCIGVLEAQAGGCPIVTSDFGALKETVGEGGIVVPGQPGSEEYMTAYVKAASSILSDENKWNLYSQAGLKRAREKYNWEHVVDRLEEIL